MDINDLLIYLRSKSHRPEELKTTLWQHMRLLHSKGLDLRTSRDIMIIDYTDTDAMGSSHMIITSDDFIVYMKEPIPKKDRGILDKLIIATLTKGVHIGPAKVILMFQQGEPKLRANIGKISYFAGKLGKGEHQFSEIVDNVIEENFTRKIVAG